MNLTVVRQIVYVVLLFIYFINNIRESEEVGKKDKSEKSFVLSPSTALLLSIVHVRLTDLCFHL